MSKKYNNKYYVYQVLFEGDVVYVGKGSGKRINHITSGCSHNRHLNELYFRNILLGEPEMEVSKIHEGLSEVVALEMESSYIKNLLPRCNIRLNNSNDNNKVSRNNTRPNSSSTNNRTSSYITLPDNYDDFEIFIEDLYNSKTQRSVSLKEFATNKLKSSSWESLHPFIQKFVTTMPKGTVFNGGHNASDFTKDNKLSDLEITTMNTFNSTFRKKHGRTPTYEEKKEKLLKYRIKQEKKNNEKLN